MDRPLEHDRKVSYFEGVFWLVFAGLAFFYTFQFDGPLPVYDFGPAHWPRMVLIGMFVATAWLIYSTWKRDVAPPRTETEDSDDGDAAAFEFKKLGNLTRLRVALIFAVPVLYTFLMHKLGFLLTTPFFLFVYMRLMGVQRLRTLIIVTVSVYAMLVLVFVKLIFTYLPPGAGVFNAINGKILGLLM